MFRECLAGIRRADCIVANLDGSDADSGTCVELDYALSLGKPIVGFRTDLRASEDNGLNLMVARACTRLLLCPSTRTHIGALAANRPSVQNTQDVTGRSLIAINS